MSQLLPAKAIIAVLIVLTLSFIARIHATGCEHFGSKCPKDGPCCNQGWCSADIKFCAMNCDPVNSFSADSCLPTPGCVSFRDNFDNAATLMPQGNFSGNPFLANWTSDFEPNNAYIKDGKLVLEILQDRTKLNEYGKYQGFGTTVSSVRSLHKGNITARLRTASSSPGVVSSWITRNVQGDELDFEWVGRSPRQVQTNWYQNGVFDWSRGVFSDLPELDDASASFHEYTIGWEADQVRWFVDGRCVRVLELNGTNVFGRSQQWHFSVWDGGSGSPSTAAWAGGPTNWTSPDRVYRMEVDWVEVQCAQEMTEEQRKAEWDRWNSKPNRTLVTTTVMGGGVTTTQGTPTTTMSGGVTTTHGTPTPTSNVSAGPSKKVGGEVWILSVVVMAVGLAFFEL
ncbi:concanavalin A-like lectin/glucanase domain-containing protein [Jimgerdemannia flammicorona]|uniref:Concanavalin A-like lectin/glucanase domain-containing protein n=1 Tax=Jimgerdemannia flammicorona TaxID=994334 RepID=A0A433CXK8_9FUNG|nr:concanavalin A-like lectin/glucanase domain-containing protein [Jimgerdemannia flammicorona]